MQWDPMAYSRSNGKIIIIIIIIIILNFKKNLTFLIERWGGNLSDLNVPSEINPFQSPKIKFQKKKKLEENCKKRPKLGFQAHPILMIHLPKNEGRIKLYAS